MHRNYMNGPINLRMHAMNYFVSLGIFICQGRSLSFLVLFDGYGQQMM